ncbi:MAG: 6-phospho-3-hexuloisomerase [Chloroflexota bacterium]|nr:6-phospho-3-hexuloisomerase [Chloroflexota bacterium]
METYREIADWNRAMTLLREAAAELAEVAGRMDEAALAPALEAITSARRVMLFGNGRERLMMQALAMRLYHLGLDVCMYGDMEAFPLGPGDLFLCAAGPGEISTASALCGVAKGAGARVLVVTAEPDGATSVMADDLLVIPAQTMARDIGGASVLPMGSLFEGAMFLVFEVLILKLRDVFGESAETMRARHTNME